MKYQRTYSTAKFFALCIVFIILGAASAVSVTTLVFPVAQRPSSFILLTDKDTYYINEAMIIYVANVLKETVNFKDDTYGLHFERWVNGKWEFMLTIGNSSRTTTLQPIGEGTYKAAVTYELGENFVEGKYKVVSVGEITQNGKTTSTEAHKEFHVVKKPPPPTVLLLLNVTADKTLYKQGDSITITLKNELNETIQFADSLYGTFFEKWNGVSWEFYSGTAGGALDVIKTLNPREKVEILSKLGEPVTKPFLLGKYRVVSVGWIYRNGEFVQVGGFAEFKVE